MTGNTNTFEATRRIWKYTMSKTRQTFSVPRHARLLHMLPKGRNVEIWFLIDPAEEERQDRTFFSQGTGVDFLYSHNTTYRGTVRLPDDEVYHIFEDKRA